ncbi:MAG: outer membrane beta-barrel protein [Pseudomonadota bacterium]
MVSVKVAALAGFTALFATAAHAADMPQLLPPVELPAVEEFGGWYLRGDIGMTNQGFKSLFHPKYNDPGTLSVSPSGMGWDSSMFFGLGVGYKFNDWFRADLTGEYRGKANFHGSDIVRTTSGPGVDNYSGSKSEWVVMGNAYVDLGTWYGFTPYVGAGVGAARITISGFRDDSVFLTPGLGVGTYMAQDASKWNFAWALHAGITYKVTQAMSIDLGYRYIDLGSATTGSGVSFDGTNANGRPFTFNHIYSHDLKLGVRWMLDAPVYERRSIDLPPLMRKG